MNAPDKPMLIVQTITRAFVNLPHVVSLTDRMTQLIQHARTNEEPENLLVLGESGVGKSRVLQKFRNKYSPVVHPEFTEVPVLYVSVPANGNASALASAMLLALGSPFWDRGKIKDLTFQLHCLLKQCKVKVILLDEVNHLVDKGGIKTHHYTADWLKVFLDQAGIPIVMAGIPRAMRLLKANDQLRSRFREIIYIKPFSVANEVETHRFCEVLATFTKMMAGVEVIKLTSGDLPKKMLFATNGYLRDLRRLLVRAVEIAFRDGSQKIRLSTLEEAFRQVVYADAPNDRNPFCANFTNTPLTESDEPFAPREN
ncbi:TniB protein [Duganella sp. CF402]|uniref:TniB family NTP-binding protein n=1 Tax=unclassified Duganella TaxID=2636909 RepID=UPI0008BE109C|nr:MULTISPECIES: TniB family NTP-binding protein [unclassified Duganella]RZT05356.1 TniB protein [Duganella sp. BK701]SEN10852.1 TniB protein [Duganella sp. CF402]